MKAKSHHSDLIQQVIDLTTDETRLKIYTLMKWTLLIGNETAALMSGAMPGELDEMNSEYLDLCGNEIENIRDINICA